jgi:hypothetical protein
MPTQTHVMVARDRRARTHSIVRATMPWELDRPVPAATADQLNTLMMAKTPLSLVEAAELVGPLRRRGDGLEGRLFLTAAQLGGLVADGTLGEPDARQLVDECVLDPLWRLADGGTFEREGRNPIGSGEGQRRPGLPAPHGPRDLHRPEGGEHPLELSVCDAGNVPSRLELSVSHRHLHILFRGYYDYLSEDNQGTI